VELLILFDVFFFELFIYKKMKVLFLIIPIDGVVYFDRLIIFKIL